MPENYHPSVDVDFIISNLLRCNKVIPGSRSDIGQHMTTFVLEGNKPMHKRHVIITHSNGEVNFNQASSLAIKFHFMGNLLRWLEEFRNWKEGEYVDVKEMPESIEPEEEE